MPSLAWWGNGHHILSTAAVLSLDSTEMPRFFIEGAAMIAHCSVDPDLLRNKATPHASAAESPDHFLDLELLQGKPLPPDRWAFIALCAELGVDPPKAGFLPYAVIERTEALAIAFAEHRKWPNDSLIRQKCLVYAGNLAHYAEDICQPLHLTIHYDGRVAANGVAAHKGIHARVDGLIERLSMRPDSLAADQSPALLAPLAGKVFEQVYAANRLVDSTYALHALVDGKEYLTDPAVRRYARQRAREAVRFTASVFLTAWEMSRRIALASWLDRANHQQPAAGNQRTGGRKR